MHYIAFIWKFHCIYNLHTHIELFQKLIHRTNLTSNESTEIIFLRLSLIVGQFT